MQKYYGIKDVYFIWHGEWADAELLYKNKLYNEPTISGTMWEDFNEDNDTTTLKNNQIDELFYKYMQENSYYIYELLEMLQGEEVEIY